jgi:hypothetical protein
MKNDQKSFNKYIKIYNQIIATLIYTKLTKSIFGNEGCVIIIKNIKKYHKCFEGILVVNWIKARSDYQSLIFRKKNLSHRHQLQNMFNLFGKNYFSQRTQRDYINSNLNINLVNIQTLVQDG